MSEEFKPLAKKDQHWDGGLKTWREQDVRSAVIGFAHQECGMSFKELCYEIWPGEENEWCTSCRELKYWFPVFFEKEVEP